MENVGNLLFLIPVVFAVIIRIIAAQNKQKQNQRKAASRPKPAEYSAKKAPVKKAVAQKKAPQKKGSALPAAPPAVPVVSAAVADREKAITAQAGSGEPHLEELQRRLGPLRMGVVWAELLGPSRAENPF
jgi:hypothetical protein